MERLLPIVCELHCLILFPNVERKVVLSLVGRPGPCEPKCIYNGKSTMLVCVPHKRLRDHREKYATFNETESLPTPPHPALLLKQPFCTKDENWLTSL
ncbi:hypothetical protein OUZ56_005227 [Daphnia magna]|uniref:Uncharacterized protein n=1 Tax=Daphnia magna TaxID=35525 RepID=A0ABQ9YS75_9CRUS|nr:hypothetical protein OUZ56_005227 [Daphnia magna]